MVVLGAWAIGTWAQPLGPMAWGVVWVPLLIGALLLGLLLAAVPGPRVPARSAQRDAEAAAAGAVGAVVWVLLADGWEAEAFDTGFEAEWDVIGTCYIGSAEVTPL